jgi:hypothetical protein
MTPREKMEGFLRGLGFDPSVKPERGTGRNAPTQADKDRMGFFPDDPDKMRAEIEERCDSDSSSSK